MSSVFSLAKKNWAMALGHCRWSLPRVYPGSLWLELQELPLMSFPREGRGKTWFWL